MKKMIYVFFVAALITGCKESKENNDEMMPVETDGGIGDGAPSLENAFAQSVEKAHNKQAFLEHDIISYDIQINFGGNPRLDGHVVMKTNSTKIEINIEDGTKIMYDGTDVFLSPSTSEMKSARFDIFTWPYFMAMPFKLSDPGTKWSDLKQITVNNNEYSKAKLSFENEIGDTSDDWYQVYVDNTTNLLSYAAYIVTFGKTKEKAEAEPHAIVYANYEVIDGIAIADQWKFYNWSEEKELFGEPIGNATLTNIKFMDAYDFKVPTDAKKIESPANTPKQ
ncbi:DUF6503 family protein [Cochleicola gelatinilyticus]|uniref:Heat-shock protein Hsp90 n=1 Tax=Cochleicola gelatinilyticus TaxID=1763537 RepID=A0A167KA43_9FLAO|nr:DUF6503 family protein [Cochleicola gelatinilyticus]OAB81550.1 hypothetical protein ULVI_01650 [Cochleicola gelatinilyticus]